MMNKKNLKKKSVYVFQLKGYHKKSRSISERVMATLRSRWHGMPHIYIFLFFKINKNMFNVFFFILRHLKILRDDV